MKAVRIHENGGPEVLRWEDAELPPPGPGEVCVRHTAIALNFSDINVRQGGFYMAAPLRFPLILGNEGAGTVAAVGTGCRTVTVGQRVAYVGSGGPFYENTGAYAEARNLPESCLIPLPDDISDTLAAAALLKGLTASMVINRVYRPQPNEAILVHTGAAGVGSLLCQWASHRGATVIGTVGSREKMDTAKANGCDHVVLYRETDFVEAVRRLAPGGVAAVFDGVGRDTFVPSLDCIRPFGMAVNYGNASGHVPPLDLILLSKKGSLSVSRPGFSHHIADAEHKRAACEELFDLLRRGVLRVQIGRRYALRDAAEAHRDVEARRITGSALLIP